MIFAMGFGLGLGTLAGLSVSEVAAARDDAEARRRRLSPSSHHGRAISFSDVPDRRWPRVVVALRLGPPFLPVVGDAARRLVADLQVGPYLFSKAFAVPTKYAGKLGEQADSDRLVEVPDAGTPVTAEMRALLPFTEPWVQSPDYERVRRPACAFSGILVAAARRRPYARTSRTAQHQGPHHHQGALRQRRCVWGFL